MEISTGFCTILVLILVIQGKSTYADRNLNLLNNRYEGLLVSISDETSQDHCNGIIHGLKVVLSRFSSMLWSATEGRASLGKVTISLPKSWKTNALTCSLLQPVEPVAPSISSQIYIRGSHPLYGIRPWTQQSQGCGRPGDFIQMGAEILRAVSNESHTQTAHQLLRQWTKFRWGIFDETGYEGDPMYPAFYRDPHLKERRPNKCPWTKELPFCDSENHVPEAPNKQNALCMGRSAWDIIQQSEDFANGRNSPSNNTILQEPKFKFVQEGSPRFVLAIEDTAVMNMQRRWEFVRKAVRRTVVYDVPDGTYMALVVFNSVAKTMAPLSKINSVSDVRQRIGSSLPRNPSTVPESHKCVLCGIQESIRALGHDAVGANIILVTTGSGAANQHQMDEIVRVVENSGVRITPIVYPLTEKPGSASTFNLEPIIKANQADKGTLFTVIDEGVGNDSKVSMMVSLMDALLAAVRLSGPKSSPTPFIVHSKSYPGGISSISSGTFRLDESMGRDARFSVYYYDLNHVGNMIQLTTPSGSIMASVNMQEEDGDANVIFVNIRNAERGLWRYRVENRADSHQGLHIQVTALENLSRKISVRIWTSAATGSTLTIPDANKPIILYAEVKDRESPVIEAQVQAKLQRLGTNATGYPYEPLYINLTDNGAGDPDITKGDGVYSRYLPQSFAYPGHYELRVVADHNEGLAKAPSDDILSRRSRMFGEMQSHICCGNDLKYDQLKPVAPFRREVSYGTINVVSNSQDKDRVPPSRILDMSVETNEATREVMMRWTAPGNDNDWGRAHHYEAVLASSWAEAKAFEGEMISNLPVPHMVSLEQSFTFTVTRYDQVLYVAIRAIDSIGNKGGVSNIASIWIPNPPTTRPPTTTVSIDLPSGYSAEPKGHGLTQSMSVADLEYIAVLAGSAIAIMVFLIVMVVCYCRYASKKTKQKKKKGDKIETNNKNIMIKTNSSIILEQDDSRDSADSTVKDVEALKDVRSLSPVQSWAASKLLAEHERRFSVSGPPVVEQQHGSVVQYGASIQDPFPDVTLTGTHSYPNSQASSTTHSEPPAYQPAPVGDGYIPYPYPAYHTGFNIEELPPYTQGASPQSSQVSTVVYNQDQSVKPSELAYTHDVNQYYPADMPAFVGDPASYGSIPPVNYIPPQTEGVLRQPMGGRKVPPPVAPKPQVANRSNVSPSNSGGSSSGEMKRRNVTQV